MDLFLSQLPAGTKVKFTTHSGVKLIDSPILLTGPNPLPDLNYSVPNTADVYSVPNAAEVALVRVNF